MTSPLTDQYVMGEDIASLVDSSQINNGAVYLHIFNNGAGPFTGGHGSNGMVATLYYVLEDNAADWDVVVDPPSSCSTTLWSDDFESGDPLSDDYTDLGGDITKTAGVGNGGGQGVDSDGNYFSEFSKTFTPNTRNGCISFDVKADAALHAGDGGGFGNYYIEVHDPTGPNGLTSFGLYSGGTYSGTDFGDITIYNSSFASIADVDEALADGVYKTIRVEFEMSSIVAGARQADGWIKLYVDDVLLSDLSGLTIGAYHAVNNPNNYWGGVRFAPQGHGDNLLVRN